MAIDIELAGLKSAGTYRFERDLSTLSSGISTESYSNLRLIVGFSKKGPFNSVQLITSPSQFIKLYGNIDRSLEKRGSYFHRSALVALSAGPILCLNLLTLNPDQDQIMHRSFSANINATNNNICTLPYHTVYNTDKFWFLSSESYLDSVHKFDKNIINGEDSDNDIFAHNETNILNFTNVGNKPISVLVKKASKKNTKGYEITLNEWFGAENVPEYFNGSSFVSDYMVEVYVIGGDFGPKLSENEYGKSVDTDLFDETIKTLYYTDYSDSTNSINPYDRFASDIIYQEYFDKNGFKANKLNKFLSLPSVNVIATYVGSLLPNFTNKLNQNIWIEDLINNDTLTTGLLCSIDVDLIESAKLDEESGFVKESIDIIGHNLHNCFDNLRYVNFLSYGFSDDLINKIAGNDSDYNDEFRKEILVHYPKSKITTDITELYINDSGTPLDKDANNEIIIASESFENKDIKVGDMILSYENIKTTGVDGSRLTRVVEIKPLYKREPDGTYNKISSHFRVICSDMVQICYPIENDKEDKTKPYIIKYSTIDNISDRFHWTFLKGFKVNEKSMPNGSNERQNEILNMLSKDNEQSNLYNALIDRDHIQWRYVVDTFGYGIESECKKIYPLLCKGRQSGLAIVNAPSMKDFKRNIEPTFVDAYGAVKSEYIANGGNLDKAPNYLFSLPKEENGASWAAYFYPYLKISDLAAVKTVPPAAYVSNLYINKYTNAKPWSIVAGPKRGVISGNQVIGVECSLVHDDRDYLEPMGINPIVWENGVGIEIFANKTAKQTPVSALSSIHAREVCIYIQDNVESILKRYNWEANTARHREEIKTLVDSFLTNVKQGDGIYDFKTVMDTTNNTSEVIDRNMGVIDIYVEVVRGLEILAQRLTVLKTGTIESGNFE